jgi:hypothetical protein
MGGACFCHSAHRVPSPGITRLHGYYKPVRHPTRPGLSLAGVRLGDTSPTVGVFHRDHDTGMAEVLRDLQAAVGHVPPREHAAEARPLQEELQKIQEGRRRGPQLLGDILPLVLARLEVGAVQSEGSGE